MSTEAVQAIIGRAVLDQEFRKALIDNAAKACQGYDLTEEELEALEELDGESFETFAGKLPPRISKRGAGGGWGVG